MKQFKHTNKTTKVFNKLISDYKAIDSDKDLTKRKLSYSDYQSMGFILDSLRYEGQTETFIKSIADYFKKLGCQVELKNINFVIKL